MLGAVLTAAVGMEMAHEATKLGSVSDEEGTPDYTDGQHVFTRTNVSTAALAAKNIALAAVP